MKRPSPHTMRPSGRTLGVRWLVLLVILFGTVFSSIGSISSHGLAAMAAAMHDTPGSSDVSSDHGHVHDDETGGDGGWHEASLGTVVEHAHHGADHSHDKAHALPTAWRSAAAQLPVWLGHVLPWTEMVRADRLERPPMG